MLKKSGSFDGKSNKLGFGGRSAQVESALEKKGLPQAEIGGIIGKLARKAGTAPGQPNFHGHSSTKMSGKNAVHGQMMGK
jgi:hypothetical protein